nr:MPF2-like [Ipomoea batatas]
MSGGYIDKLIVVILRIRLTSTLWTRCRAHSAGMGGGVGVATPDTEEPHEGVSPELAGDESERSEDDSMAIACESSITNGAKRDLMLYWAQSVLRDISCYTRLNRIVLEEDENGLKILILKHYNPQNGLMKNLDNREQTVAELVTDYNQLLKVKIGIQEESWKLSDEVLKLREQNTALELQNYELTVANNALTVENNALKEENRRLLTDLEVHKAVMQSVITSLKGPLKSHVFTDVRAPSDREYLSGIGAVRPIGPSVQAGWTAAQPEPTRGARAVPIPTLSGQPVGPSVQQENSLKVRLSKEISDKTRELRRISGEDLEGLSLEELEELEQKLEVGLNRVSETKDEQFRKEIATLQYKGAELMEENNWLKQRVANDRQNGRIVPGMDRMILDEGQTSESITNNSTTQPPLQAAHCSDTLLKLGCAVVTLEVRSRRKRTRNLDIVPFEGQEGPSDVAFEAHPEAVQEVEFGRFLELQIKVFPTELSYVLLNSYNPINSKLKLKDRLMVDIAEDDRPSKMELLGYKRYIIWTSVEHSSYELVFFCYERVDGDISRVVEGEVFYVDRIVLFKRYLPRAFPAFIGWTSDLLKDRQNEELNNGGFCQWRIEARYVPIA